MRALVVDERGRSELMEVARPDPAADDVEIRVTMSAVGLTQVRQIRGETRGSRTGRRILGHEIVGHVERVGTAVTDVECGTRVLVSPVEACGSCEWCVAGLEHLCASRAFVGFDFDGGLAEFVRVRRRSIYPIGPEIPDGDAVLLTSALPTAVHACARARFRPGTDVVVLGVGSVGSLVCQVAKASGAGRVIALDQDRRRLEAVAAYTDVRLDSRGLDTAEVVARMMDCTRGGGQVVFESVGSPEMVGLSLQLVRPRGSVVLVGLLPEETAIPIHGYHYQFLAREPFVLPAYSYGRRDIISGIGLYLAGAIDLAVGHSEVVRFEDLETVITGLMENGVSGGRYLVRFGS